jgi:hypothetical protein
MRSGSAARVLLFGIPLSAVLVVVLGLISGGDRPFKSARIYGGPTETTPALAWRVELSERLDVTELPLSGRDFALRVIEGERVLAQARAKTDALGMAEVLLELPELRDGALEVIVEPRPALTPPFARGLVLGSLERFQQRTRQRGGLRHGKRSGDIELAVAPARGVLITAQGALDDELVLKAEQGGQALAGVRITAEHEGTERDSNAAPALVTDSLGVARLRIRPREPRVTLRASATAADGRQGEMTAVLDVVQGAIRARRSGQRLLLESTGAAEIAFVGFFDERQRYGGLHAKLAPASDGRLVADVPWPAQITAERLWIVTSSQADLSSPAAVGWPAAPSGVLAPQTLDARELLLLDSAPQAAQREQRRSRRIRIVSAAYAVTALLLTLWLFVQSVRGADARIERHLAERGLGQELASIAPQRSGRTIIAIACISLGFLVLALWALLNKY